MLFLNGEGTPNALPSDLSSRQLSAFVEEGVDFPTNDTGQKRFGDGSISFPTTSTRVRFDVADLNVAEDEELTIDFWIRPAQIPSFGSASIVGSGYAEDGNGTPLQAFRIVVEAFGGISFQLGTTNIGNFTEIVKQDTWTHLAFVRELVDPTNENPGSRGTIVMYVNGTRLGTPQPTALARINAPDINIGQVPSTVSGTSSSFVGHIDEFRITKGVARYTGASFTLPAAPSCIGA
jgi:hypothetical protein